MAESGGEIMFERRGAAGLITLNRPQALNAVTHAMVRALRVQLDRWADDPAITRVVITAAGERAFSAGFAEIVERADIAAGRKGTLARGGDDDPRDRRIVGPAVELGA